VIEDLLRTSAARPRTFPLRLAPALLCLLLATLAAGAGGALLTRLWRPGESTAPATIVVAGNLEPGGAAVLLRSAPPPDRDSPFVSRNAGARLLYPRPPAARSQSRKEATPTLTTPIMPASFTAPRDESAGCPPGQESPGREPREACLAAMLSAAERELPEAVRLAVAAVMT